MDKWDVPCDVPIWLHESVTMGSEAKVNENGSHHGVRGRPSLILHGEEQESFDLHVATDFETSTTAE